MHVEPVLPFFAARVRKSAGVWRTPGLVTRMSGSGQAANGSVAGPSRSLTSAATDVDLDAGLGADFAGRLRSSASPCARRASRPRPRAPAQEAAARPRPLLPPQTNGRGRPPDAEVSSLAAATRQRRGGANEPASRRGGTRKRPAMSFSCSRSVMISASIAADQHRGRQELRVVARRAGLGVAAGVEEGDVDRRASAAASSDAAPTSSELQSGPTRSTVSVASAIGVHHRHGVIVPVEHRRPGQVVGREVEVDPLLAARPA